jgi:hypothetical protein
MREYQHIGLDWLMTIYTRRLNGILADEMGTLILPQDSSSVKGVVR